ncbi:MAM and LDL-receptor class A domain-containing 1-like isoform X1 [Paramuricea clavata]|uniref:MAM and LDL-receptor class A domain-containing 1-like isoform X1 n=1 Tax=Paramuricea clavata TaxID=317549 RepID=A0A7D9HJM5_PARCT|nr:MAM and LDL-receptor class A domain-containing 1-like isoform X1 [Paramuricea clavata]
MGRIIVHGVKVTPSQYYAMFHCFILALVKLSQRVSLKPQIRPVCLPQHGVSVNEVSGQECYITGWGRTGASKPGATVLQQARLPVISESKCRQHMGSQVTRQMICAGFGGNSTVSGCNGDSGGPFVCRDNSSNPWILQGAVSWGTRTCSAGHNEFTVFARVAEFVNWIKQQVGNVPRPSSANCNFDNGDTCSYQYGAGQFNWKVNRGPTPSSGTGPSSDVSGRGYYLFIETSSPRQFGDKATILTPYLNGTQCMKFSYHMYGGGIGVLNIYANNQTIFSRSGNQGNRWISVETSILQGGKYIVEFEGVRGGSYEGDIAIDAISFTPGSCPFQTPKPPTPRPTNPPTSSTNPPTQAANCNFDNGDTCGYQNGAGQFNWKVNRGSTSSSGTGPSSDVSGRGYYLFIETSSPRQFGDKATILTPYLNGVQCMKFSYHMYGCGVGVLNIYVNNQRMFSKSGNQGNRWVRVETSILQGGRYMVKFEGVRGGSYQGDIGIDGISFTPGSCSFQTPKPPTPRPTNPPTSSTNPPTSTTNPPTQAVRCNFDQGLCSFTNGANDDFDWTVRSGSTSSSNTGPSQDVSGNGKYVYIETSSPRVQGDKAYLVSPQVNGNQCLKFSYHMHGASMGSLIVYQNIGNRMVELFNKSGDQGNQWNKAEVQINNGTSYSVVFSGVRGSSYQGDIALDEISITSGQCSIPPSGSCGQKGYGLSDFPKIVGGQDATPGEWPWQVALLRGTFPFCGGSLVSNQYVITAAHCVKSTDWDSVKIRVGEHDMRVNEGHEQDISIARNGITIHPQYNQITQYNNDIAVIRLSRSVQFTQRIKPVCFNTGIDFTGQRCYITGWGRLQSGGSTPKVLQEAQVPIVTPQECKKSYGNSRITDKMLCAGYSRGGTDTCQGDSGGPMVCQHSDGSWYLSGVTSWGRGCASAGYYGVYAHVANLYPWVKQVTGL